MIGVQGLVKRYGAFVALDGVSFEVGAGEVFGFVGPNGAGKTTTLKILAGLTAPTAGRVTVGGVDVSRDPAAVRSLIGYMPDFFGVYERLTAREYLAFYAACHRLPRSRIDATVTDLLELVRLPEKRDAAVDTLSRGMKQRLCLARALVHDPAVLLLDEPASGLDPRARAEMRELVTALAAMGKTVVLSSHILPELAEMCSTFGVLDHGRMVASGPLESLRGLGTGQVAKVTVLGDPEVAQAVAAELAGVSTVVRRGDVLEIAYEGGPQIAADVLSALAVAGVRVVSFVPASTGLEDVFLEVTAEEGAT